MSNASAVQTKVKVEITEDVIEIKTPLTVVKNSSQLEKIKSRVESTSDKWARQAVAKLVTARGENAFELGGYLNRVQKNELWPDAANVSFVEWMKAQGIGKSRGYALRYTYKTIISCDLPHDILDRIGWSKLTLIVPLLKSDDDTHNAKWIDRAEKLSQLELRQAVRKENGKKKTPKPVTTKKLRSVMKQFQPKDVLEMFAEIWPDIDIKVSL